MCCFPKIKLRMVCDISQSYLMRDINVNKIKKQSSCHYHGNRGTKIMGCGDVRYCFAMAILVTSLRIQSGDVLLFYVSFSLLFFHTFLSARFLGNALIKLDETLQEYHMPCEVVLLGVDFFKMAAVAMETVKMLKKIKNTKVKIKKRGI